MDVAMRMRGVAGRSCDFSKQAGSHDREARSSDHGASAKPFIRSRPKRETIHPITAEARNHGWCTLARTMQTHGDVCRACLQRAA
jgi:hypothetical protein